MSQPITTQMAAAHQLPARFVGGTFHPPHCPICDVEIESYQRDRPVIDEGWSEVMPLWEGGPLVSVPRLTPEPVYGRPVWTVQPCGHTWTSDPDHALRWRYDPPPEPDYVI